MPLAIEKTKTHLINDEVYLRVSNNSRKRGFANVLPKHGRRPCNNQLLRALCDMIMSHLTTLGVLLPMLRYPTSLSSRVSQAATRKAKP
jgi:hypothetical protein